MKTKKNKLVTMLIGLCFLLAIVLGGIYQYGPTLGAKFGFPIYLAQPTPKKYTKDAIMIIEDQALFSDSIEAKTTKKKMLEQAESVKSYQDAYPLIENYLAQAGGKHSFLLTPKESKEWDSGLGIEMPKVQLKDQIAYIKMNDFTGSQEQAQKYADTVFNFLKDHQKEIKGVILDLQNNRGGDMGPMLAGVSPLLPDGKLMSFKTKQGEFPVKLNKGKVTGGGTSLQMSDGQFKLKVPIAILTSQETASSAEATLLSFKGLKNVKTFGKETAGYASANIMIGLYDDAQIIVTMAEDVDRLGNVYNALPIQPNVKTESALKEAQSWLKQ